MDGPSEQQLVEAARAGDGRSFEVLCARSEALLRARLRRWVNGSLRRKVSIEDVLQEAYLTAHQRLPEFENRGDGAFRAWLTRIAELKAREVVRRYVGAGKRCIRREVSGGARSPTASVVGRGPSPSQVAIAHERRAAVTRAMAELPGDYRTVMELVQVRSLSLAEAALQMDRSKEAVRKLYGRALCRLADRLHLPR